jgi:Probable zinc-ribbon domain
MNYQRELEPKIITCVVCSADFEFSEGEAKFYQSKNLAEPRRCKDCRILAREQRDKRHAAQQNMVREQTRSSLADVVMKTLGSET